MLRLDVKGIEVEELGRCTDVVEIVGSEDEERMEVVGLVASGVGVLDVWPVVVAGIKSEVSIVVLEGSTETVGTLIEAEVVDEM